LADTDPSATNPVGIWIGNELRWITADVSFTNNAGSNSLNMGSSELATKEVDLFVYAFWRSSDSTVRILVSRIPYGKLGSDFGTSSQEKGRLSLVGQGSTDEVVNVGRFAATLSASPSYNWSVPSFTNANLIQEPVYETRVLNYQPVYSAAGSMTYTSVSTLKAIYQIRDRTFYVDISAQGTTGGSADPQILASLPISLASASNGRYAFAGGGYDNAAVTCVLSNTGGTNMRFIKNLDTNWGLGTNKIIYGSGTAPIIE
ncbi:MAG: hypothetical protein ACO3UU_11095, partial [Minisyncoccia bacterium]